MVKHGNNTIIKKQEEFITCSRCGNLERVELPIEVAPDKKTDWTMNTTPEIRYMFKDVANQKRMPLDKTLAYLVWLHGQVKLNKIPMDIGGIPKVESE